MNPSVTEQLDEAIASAPEWQPENANTEAPQFEFYTADQFDALDLRRDYHVTGILAAGPVPSVMGGSFKTLKTSIAMDLGISLATSSPFLNHYPVSRRVRVAMMSGESGGFALQSLARRVAHAKGWTMAGVGDYFRICTEVVNLGLHDQLAEVERFINENEIGLFVVDPTYLAMRGIRNDDAGSIFAMGAFLEPLSQIGERTGCTPLIVHHNSRGATRANPNEPAELADIAWSGFAEWAGQWLLLARRERYNPDSNGEHKLWLTAGGRDGHSTLVGVNVTEGRHDDIGGRRWGVEVEQASAARQQAVEVEQERRDQQREDRQRRQAEQDKDAVLTVMRAVPDGDTKRSIRDRAGLNAPRLDRAIAALIADGLVVVCEVNKGNQRVYDGFKLHRDASVRSGTSNPEPVRSIGTVQQPYRGCTSTNGPLLRNTDSPDNAEVVPVQTEIDP